MKSRTSLKTRLLALVLTVLMTVGVLPFSVFASGSSAIEAEPMSDGSSYSLPTFEELKGILGNKLIYANTFDGATTDKAGAAGFNQTADSAYQNFAEIRNGANTSKIADGVLAYASALDTSVTKYKGNLCVYTKASNNNAPDATYSGKNFVYQADYKLGTAMPNGTLASLNCTLEKGKTVGSNPVYVNASGELLLNTDGDTDGDTKIGKLSKDEFTSVAFAANVAANTVDVYINGVNVGQTILITEAQKTTVAGYASAYTNGFGITSVGCYRESGGAETNNGVIFYVDNIALYESDRFIANAIMYLLYDYDTNTGYVAENDAIYYYENGVKKGNLTSEDGILTIDENGKVFFEQTPVASLDDYYKYVENNIILQDGVYSGVYKSNLLSNDSVTYYCYDGNKNLIKGVAVYDAITAGTESDDTKVVGFSIDTNGVATPLNGYYEVASGKSYFYTNGVRTKGFVRIEDEWYFIENDFNFGAGYRTDEDRLYYFDAADSFKGALVNGVHAGDGVTYKYYENGVALVDGIIITSDGAKYLANEDGTLLCGLQIDPDTGNSHFFYSAVHAKKFQMAIGVSVIWNGSVITVGDDGIINAIDGKIFDRWTYVDGEWYYSDASGNLANGLVYLAKDETGAAGGYYYFVNGQPVKETFVEVYGTLMYFHTDGRAPSGVTFVKYTATNFPEAALGETNGEYMYFINGVLPTGASETIIDGKKYSFTNGRDCVIEELDKDNPEILVTIHKDGRADSFYLNSEDDGKFNMLLTNYPCYTITVYDITTGTRVAVMADAQTGRYPLEGEHTYEIRYDAADHIFGTTPIKTVGATCGANGYNEYACTVDGCIATNIVAITERPEHVYSTAEEDITVLRAATCVKPGIGVTWCKNGCGDVHTFDIPATGEHEYAIELYHQASTCTVEGYKVLGCTMCDAEIHDSVDRADHVFTTYVDGEKATCVAGGTKVATCDTCGIATDTIATPRDFDNHVGGNDDGTLERYDEACVENFELFQVTIPSTCLEEGIAVFRCKDCGGFVYEVAIELDPDNHHYNKDEEYLAVLDRNGEVIETVKIVGGKVIRDGEVVADEDPTVENRLEMHSYSLKICGYEAEWRIDCKKGCLDSDTDAVFYTVVEAVEGEFRHSFDLSVLYTTTDENDPLYGYHYYKCTKCQRAAGATAHEMTYTDNGDGTHNYACTCVDEATNEAYGEFDITCTFETKFDENGHWTECVCGAKTDILAHTAEAGYDANEHWTVDCDCGYNDRTAHTWGDVDGVDSTCFKEGYTDHKACDCGAKLGYEVIETKGHNIPNKYEHDGELHWRACVTEGCTFKYEETHKYITVPAKEPTCEDKGYDVYRICVDCGHIEGTVDCTDGEDIPEINANDHDVENQPYNFDENKHWQVCKTCNKLVEKEHALGELISDEEGNYACADCEYVKIDHNVTWWKQLGLDRVEVEGHYYYTYGETVNKLVVIKNNYYYFDANGYLVLVGDIGVNNANVKEANGTFDTITTLGNRGVITNAIITTADGTFYIMDGVMQTGWQNIEGKDYYFNSVLNEELVNTNLANGVLVKATEGASTITALNYTNDAKILVNVAADGARLLGVVDNGDGTASYYLDGTVGKLTGRIEDNYYNVGNIYFANSEGVLYTGTNVKIYDGAYYNFHDTEYYVTEWLRNKELTIGGDTVYTDGDGKAIDTGWFSTVGVGGYYIIDGVKVVKNDAEFEYKQIGDYYYEFDNNGVVAYYNGWNDERTLYISNGNVSINRFDVIDGDKYYFDGNGQIVKAALGETILVYINSFVYEMDENGVATQYDVVANGAVWIYFLDENGVVDNEAKGYYTTTGLIKGQAFDINTFTYIFDDNGKLVVSQQNYLCNDVYYIIDAEGKATPKEEE